MENLIETYGEVIQAIILNSCMLSIFLAVLVKYAI
jgi:hypothetical protein